MLIARIARKEIAAKLARITPSAETQFRVARNRKSRKAERAFLIAFMSGSPYWVRLGEGGARDPVREEPGGARRSVRLRRGGRRPRASRDVRWGAGRGPARSRRAPGPASRPRRG